MSIHSNEPSRPPSRKEIVSWKQLVLRSVENTNFKHSSRHPEETSYWTTCYEGTCISWVAFAALPALAWHLIAPSRGIESPVPTGVHTLAWTAAEWISWEHSDFFWLRLVRTNPVSVNLLRDWKRGYFRCEARSVIVRKRRRQFGNMMIIWLLFLNFIQRFFFGDQEFMLCYKETFVVGDIIKNGGEGWLQSNVLEFLGKGRRGSPRIREVWWWVVRVVQFGWQVS